MDLKRIRVIAEPNANLLYIESLDEHNLPLEIYIFNVLRKAYLLIIKAVSRFI